MSKIKSVSQFEDNIWGEATPIGADASNIDVEMSDSSTKDLQTVLGDIPSAAAPIQSQINTKVTASGGNIGNTTVSSGIQNFDSSSSETSTELLDTSVRVTNATEVTSSMWTKFNRFRKRVDNKFKDVFLSSVEDVASPSLTKTYSQSALNDYFANVVGYATAADLPDASSTIASQLSTLNNNLKNRLIYNSHLTFASYNYSAILSDVDLNNSSSSPTWMTYTNEVDSDFLRIQAGTSYGGIYNKTNYNLVVLLSLRLRIHFTADTNYTAAASIQLWKKTDDTYSYFRHLGFIVSAISTYPRALYSYTWIESIPPQGALGLRGYRDATHTSVATITEGNLMTLPLCLNL